MKICICDSDKNSAGEIKNLLKAFQNETDGFCVCDFSCGEELLDFIKRADTLIFYLSL